MPKLIVANWKMYLTHNESLAWVDAHLDECAHAASETGNKLIICPSFTTLPRLTSHKKPSLSWGAQDCGFEAKGAYTGDISAVSLEQLGCTYGIVGHSERRTYYRETNQLIAHKAQQLMGAGITPILCIGETAQEREAGKTAQALEQQLFPLINALKAFPFQAITRAYEPIWAVGTDILPSQETLSSTLGWIRTYCATTAPATTFSLLYGGSVKKPETLIMLKAAAVDGILLGRAGIDGPLLKKIILSW
jgi:triosephosphate isomerase